jgi:uncharacterized protein
MRRFFGLAISGIFYKFIAKSKKIAMQNITGRENEIEFFHSVMESNKSEFVAVYGRRRVGKTFLVRQFFEDKFTFHITGLANAGTGQQLSNFSDCYKKTTGKTKFDKPANWKAAFQLLMAVIEKSKHKRKVIFIDELPWFDTVNGGFIPALEHFWNHWASARKDVVLIVCGSAASWMINKLINNKGGLHNRITYRLKIVPFTLYECEMFLKAKSSVLDRYQIIQLYMVLGGIPFYWEQVQKRLSAAQNIERICFSENGLLRTEFTNLFSSLFTNWDKHISIVQVLAKKAAGLTRDEIVRGAKIPNAGSTTRIMNELEESGFIKKYVPFGKKMRNSLYQLVDFYTLFYLRFLKDVQKDNKNNWLNSIDSPKHRAWSGYAFEQVCLCHAEQIKKALGIGGVKTYSSSWRSTAKDGGAQIDLVIDRNDRVINLCEMKFSVNPFVIDKKYAMELRNKIGIFRKETGTRKALFLTMVTTFGLKQNDYSTGLIQNDVRMDALFKRVDFGMMQ